MEQPVDDCYKAEGQVRTLLSKARRLSIDDVVKDNFEAWVDEGNCSGGKLVEQYSEGIHVGPIVRLQFLSLFGGHVSGGAAGLPVAALLLLGELGQAEICEFDDLVGGQ